MKQLFLCRTFSVFRSSIEEKSTKFHFLNDPLKSCSFFCLWGKFVYKFDWISVSFDALSTSTSYTLGSNWVIFHNSLTGCLWSCRCFVIFCVVCRFSKNNFSFSERKNIIILFFEKLKRTSTMRIFFHVCLLLGILTSWKMYQLKSLLAWGWKPILRENSANTPTLVLVVT